MHKVSKTVCALRIYKSVDLLQDAKQDAIIMAHKNNRETEV